MSGIAIVGRGMWGPRLAAAAQRAGLDLVRQALEAHAGAVA
jgi:hypothetical protein